jgi:parallel beta-helix repeat protein
MKRVFSIVFALALVLSFSLVVTVPVAAVSGNITGDTTWSTDQTITADVTVNSGVTLTIDPGVTVKFNKGTSGPSLIINGNLVAEGTSGSNIVFTSSEGSPAANDWWRIQFNTGSHGSMKYCNIAYGTIPVYLNDVDGTAGNPAVTIANCNIHDSGDTGISLMKSDYNTVKDNTVTLARVGQAIWLDTSSHNLVEGNTCTDSVEGGYGIRAVGNFGTFSGNIIRGNTCTGEWTCGIGLFDGADNIVENNTCTGTGLHNAFAIETGYGGTSSGNIIRGNTFSSASGLVMFARNWRYPADVYGTVSNIQITGNTITGVYGIRLMSVTAGVVDSFPCNIDATQFTVNYNNLLCTTYGVKNNGAGTLDAECNWWGTAVESGIIALIFEQPGTVDHTPWLTEAYTPQKSVAPIAGGGTAYFDPDQGSIEGLTAVSPPTPPPATLTLPYGMFNFTICCFTGTTVTLTITLPGAVPPGTKWYKYNNGAWDALPIGGGGTNVITVTLEDNNSVHDEDPTQYRIIDQGAPGFEAGGAVGWQTYPVSKARVLLPWIALLAAIMAGASLLVLRRRRAHI